MMKLYPPITLVIMIVFGGVALFSWSAYQNKKQHLNAQKWVNHTHTVIDHLDEIWILLNSNESAMRAFGITGNSLFINEYAERSKKIDQRLRTLGVLFGDDSGQVRNLQQLGGLVASKRQSESQLHSAASVSTDSAARVIASLRGKKIMDSLSQLLTGMKAAESNLMKRRVEATQHSANNAYTSVRMGAVIAFVFIIATLLRLNRDMALRRKAQIELKESETKYREFVENAGVVSFICDLQGFFTFISPQARELTGYSAEELTGHHFSSLIVPDYVEEVTNHYVKQAVEKIPSTTIRFPIIHQDGRKKWVEQDTILLIKKGQHIGYQSIVKDITDRMQTNERLMQIKREQQAYQERIQSILDHTPLAIYVNDLEGKYILINKRFREIFNVTEKEILGKTLADVYKGSHLDRYISAGRKVIETGKPVEFEDIMDEDQHVLTIMFPLYGEDNQLFGVSGFMKDITDMVRYREQLINARKRAESAEMLQEQFLASMSHEIRTPMNGIVGMTNLLLKTSLEPQQREYLQIIKQSSDNLLVLINDILDLSKIKAGKISIEKIPFTVHDLLRTVTASFKLKAEEKNIDFHLSVHSRVPEAIKGDPHRLSQILNNLLSNAVKFTDKGSVTLEVTAKENNGNQLTICFRVMDTGIGIEEQNLEYIFESFAQASSSTSRIYGGTGLGLTITRRLIELQNGNISVTSQPGAGTCFTVEIPFEISSMEDVNESFMHAARHDLQQFDFQRKTVLIVEDNEINRMVLQSHLQHYNLQVATAVDGLEAIEYLSQHQADLVLMDLHMPGMDGFEATEAIRKNLQLDLPVVVLSASTLRNERQRSMEMGATDYLTKPFAPEDLQNCLTKYLGTPVEKTSEAPALPQAEHEAFDLTNLVQTGNPDFITRLHQMFEEVVPASLTELREAAIQEDWEKVRFISHKLKSSLGVIRIPSLLDNMASVEKSAREKENLDTILPLVETSLQQFDAVMPSVRSAIKQHLQGLTAVNA